MSLGKERKEEVSLEAGRYPGGRLQQAVKVGMRVEGRGLSWKHRPGIRPHSGNSQSNAEMAPAPRRRML